MNRKSIVLLSCIFLGTCILVWNFNFLWTGRKIEIRELFVGTYTKGDSIDKFLATEDEWYEIYTEEQRLKWNEAGFNLPITDFNSKFLIVSRIKIRSLFTKPDECVGAPAGYPYFDYFNTKGGEYYVYAIPPIRFNRTIG